MFNCSYFDKSILNDYSPMSPKMFLGPAEGQRWPNGAHPNGVHPNDVHPNGAHPNGLPQSPLVTPGPLVTPCDSFLNKLKCLKVTKSLFRNEEKN